MKVAAPPTDLLAIDKQILRAANRRGVIRVGERAGESFSIFQSLSLSCAKSRRSSSLLEYGNTTPEERFEIRHASYDNV